MLRVTTKRQGGPNESFKCPSIAVHLGTAAKQLLLASHIEFILNATTHWTKLVKVACPTWSDEEQVTLVAVATDLENVTGYPLYLAPGRIGVCEVLTDHRVIAKRSNRSIARSQYKGVAAAVAITKELEKSASDLPCIEALKVDFNQLTAAAN